MERSVARRQGYACGHEREEDRCILFRFEADGFEDIAAAAGARGLGRRIGPLRRPPLRALADPVARACAARG